MSVYWVILHRAHLHPWSRTLSYGPSLFQNVLFPLPSVFRLPYLISINCFHLTTLCIRAHHIPPIGKIQPVFADTTLPSPSVFQSGSYHLEHLCSSALILHGFYRTTLQIFNGVFTRGLSSFLFKPAAL